MKSLGSMIQQLEPMLSTRDLTTWEQRFVENVIERTGCGRDTGKLTDNQIARLEDLYRKHFADAEPA